MSELDCSYKWSGRLDTEDATEGLRWHQIINRNSGKSKANILGFACDLGVAANKGRVGAASGPNIIRNALANLAWHTECDLFDIGNVQAKDSLAIAQNTYGLNITDALNNKGFVIGLGGGHEIAWGSYQGLARHAKKHSQKKIGIVNFDAHFDLRKFSPEASSGTPFRQIAEYCQENNQAFHYTCLGIAESANTVALFNYAKQTDTQYLLDIDCHVQRATALLEPMLKSIDELYITVCLDAFPASVAPGVSAPSAVGISVDFVIQMLRWLGLSQSTFNYNWQVADIAEMNPKFDIDSRTAKLAARIAYEMLRAKYTRGC